MTVKNNTYIIVKHYNFNTMNILLLKITRSMAHRDLRFLDQIWIAHIHLVLLFYIR